MAITSELKEENGLIIEEFKDEVTGKKGTDTDLKKRKLIEETRGDIYDLASQSLQWCGLLTSVTAILYSFLTEEQKSQIPADKRALVEGALNLYTSTETTTDLKISQNGFGFIQDLIDKENKTAQIMKDIS